MHSEQRNMKYDPNRHHRRSLRLPGHDYATPGAYFLTLCTHQRACIFGRVEKGEMQLSQFGEIVQGHWSKLPKHHAHLRLDAFIVMPNHLHGILILENGWGGAIAPETNQITNPQSSNSSKLRKCHAISEIVRGFKTFSAKRINEIRQTPGIPVWQRNFYDRIIRDDAGLQKVRAYITQNPKVWEQDAFFA